MLGADYPTAVYCGVLIPSPGHCQTQAKELDGPWALICLAVPMFPYSMSSYVVGTCFRKI